MATQLKMGIGLCGLLLAAVPVAVVATDAPSSQVPKQVAAAPLDARDVVTPHSNPTPQMSASVTPATLPQAPAVAEERNEWRVIVIQAALAEKGCYDGPVNGQWDEGTQGAVTQFVQRAKFTGPAADANDELLRGLRQSSVTLCKSPLPAGEASPTGVTKAKLRTEAQPQGGGARAGGKVRAERRVVRAPSQSPGPAVFARPVGVGRF